MELNSKNYLITKNVFNNAKTNLYIMINAMINAQKIMQYKPI